MGSCLGTVISTTRGSSHASSTRHNFPPMEQDSVLMRGAVGPPTSTVLSLLHQWALLFWYVGTAAGRVRCWVRRPLVSACIAPVASTIKVSQLQTDQGPQHKTGHSKTVRGKSWEFISSYGHMGGLSKEDPFAQGMILTAGKADLMKSKKLLDRKGSGQSRE